MNMKKLLLAFLAVFLVGSAGNFLIHGTLLKPDYELTPQLLRTPADGDAHAPYLILSFAIFSVAFVWIYAQGLEDKPLLGQGLRYGMAVWLIASVSRYLTYYAIQPWGRWVVVMQIGYELILMLVLGAVAAAIYRRQS